MPFVAVGTSNVLASWPPGPTVTFDQVRSAVLDLAGSRDVDETDDDPQLEPLEQSQSAVTRADPCGAPRAVEALNRRVSRNEGASLKLREVEETKAPPAILRPRVIVSPEQALPGSALMTPDRTPAGGRVP
jgi:hypothetical protein